MTNIKKGKKRKAHRKIIVVIIIAAVAIGGIFASKNSIGNKIEDSYNIEKVEKGDIFDYYSFSGVVESENRDNLIAKEMMQITDIVVNEGDKVKKDDVIFKTNNKEIKSDIDGEVSKIYIDENAQVLGGTKLADIVDYENLQVSIKVDEYFISDVELDQQVDVHIDSLGKNIKGVISDISKEATNVNGVSYFIASIDLEEDKDIRVGMNAEAKILNEKAENVLTIPVEALQFDDDNNPYVFIEGDKGLPVEKQVEIGINDGLQVEIISGISEGVNIMISNKETDDGDNFRPPFAGGQM